MADQLVQKLEAMDREREMRARRLSLKEALQLLADAPDDAAEHVRWREFVGEAHARGDFRYPFELTRAEWCAVTFGRQVETWSQPEISLASARLGMTDYQSYQRDAKPNATREAVRKDWSAAALEGRVFSGPNGAAIPFRSKADPTRAETPLEMERELDAKLERFESIAAINESIDLTLERADARTASGEAVIPSAALLGLLEKAINAIAGIPSGEFGPHRLSDRGTFPRWGELLAAYNDTFSKVGSGVNRADELSRRLAAVWNQDDQQARALAEKIVGSPDPLSADLLVVARSRPVG